MRDAIKEARKHKMWWYYSLRAKIKRKWEIIKYNLTNK